MKGASSTIVLVNGLPGAGKTILARTLSRALGLPLLSKDVIKETHADVLGSQPPPGWTQRRWNAALGAAASETMWALLADAPAGAVLESCWPVESRHLVRQGLRTAGDRPAMELRVGTLAHRGATAPHRTTPATRHHQRNRVRHRPRLDPPAIAELGAGHLPCGRWRVWV